MLGVLEQQLLEERARPMLLRRVKVAACGAAPRIHPQKRRRLQTSPLLIRHDEVFTRHT